MAQCNRGTKLSKVGGRRREWVFFDDPNNPPNETMLMLAAMKNEGHSWRSLAVEINERIRGKKVSHNLVRRVALGHCNSPRIDYALGIRQAPPPVEVEPCPDCGKVHKQRKACKPSRKTGKHSMVFRLDDEQFNSARDAADSHPGGRVAWLMQKIQENQ